MIVAKNLDEDSERIELPADQDGSLGIQTLAGAFPGAHGLKYKNPATGAFRALLYDFFDFCERYLFNFKD